MEFLQKANIFPLAPFVNPYLEISKSFLEACKTLSRFALGVQSI